MMRITLNVILRAMFGADGAELERLREILPGAIKLGSTLSLVPVPQWDWGRWSPWGRFYRNRREYDGSEELLHATILEVQRTRPVIDVTFRQVKAPTLEIGPWTLLKGQTVVASIGLLHADETVFPDAHRFDPDRFLARPPDPAEWIPYGGGIRRCIGAAFATMEMRVVLRTLLRDYAISPSSARDEGFRSRGVTIAPACGARLTVAPRPRTPSA